MDIRNIIAAEDEQGGEELTPEEGGEDSGEGDEDE